MMRMQPRQQPSLYRLLALCVLAALLAAFLPAASTQAQGGFSDAQVVTNYLNMRSEPNASAPLVQRLSYGTRLSALGRNEDSSWLFVSTEAGVTGWVATNWVSLRSDLVLGNLPLTNQTGQPAPAEAIAGVVEAPAGPLSAPAAEQSGSVAAGGPTALVISRVNFRTGPGTQHRSLGVLNPGVSILLQGRDAAGLWAYGTASDGRTGWVAARFLSTNLAVINALPLADGSAPTSGAAQVAQAPAAAPAQAPAAQPAAPLPSTAGSGGFAIGGHINGYSQEGWMRQAGMSWAKQQIRYSYGQDPNSVAGAINEAHARGFRILLGVVGDPGQIASIPDYFSQYASFVGGLARLGADGIEVWNEMNIDREWPTGRIDPAWYTQLLAASYNAIKANNPGTLVISGAPSPTGAEGAFGSDRVWNDDRYVAGMAAAGAAQYMDCLGLHYNEGITPPSQRSGDPRANDHYTRYFWGMVDAYWNAFGGQRPLCFTELGYLSGEGYGALPGGFAWASNVSVAQQAAWLAEAINLARSSGRVRLLIVWNVDFTHFGEDPQGGYAIVRPGGDCPACRAIAGG